MARNQEEVIISRSEHRYVEMTNGDATSVMAQLQYGEVRLRASVDATRPADDAPGMIWEGKMGEYELDLAAYFHLPDARRLWGQRVSTEDVGMFVSHRDA